MPLPSPATKTPCALLVEDSPEFALMARTWLADAAEVTAVDNGWQAAQLVRGRPWDIVVADIELPGLPGTALAELCKRIDRRLPVLLMSEHRNVDYLLSAVEQRVDGFLFKPFSKPEFVAKVDQLLLRARARGATRGGQQVLAIGAHPDDVEIGCGGALARHREAGDAVTILTLSPGARGGDALVRAAEAKAAAALLQARLVLSDLVDTAIGEGAETIERISAVVQALQPTHVYTHSEHDAHQDHRNVHRASIVACRGVENLFCYQAPSATVEFRPQLFIDVGHTFATKLAMIGAYRSQLACRAYLEEDLIRATARYWGRFCGYGLAEAMEAYRHRLG